MKESLASPVKSGHEIRAMAGKLTPLGQSYVLGFIEALLHSQQHKAAYTLRRHCGPREDAGLEERPSLCGKEPGSKV